MVKFNPEIVGETTKKDVCRMLEFSELQNRWLNEDLDELNGRADALEERQKSLGISVADADDELIKVLSDFSYDEIKNLHRQIFELDSRPDNFDLIYEKPSEKNLSGMTSLGKIIDRLELCINRRLLTKGVVNHD